MVNTEADCPTWTPEDFQVNQCLMCDGSYFLLKFKNNEIINNLVLTSENLKKKNFCLNLKMYIMRKMCFK